MPLRLYGQELERTSYALAWMNAIIHDMKVEIRRGDSMRSPKFRNADGSLRKFDIVVANPMWNQPFTSDVFDNDEFGRFSEQGGVTSGKGDWAWLQHTLACLNEHGRAAIVLDTGAVTRGSGSKNENAERTIRKWFVDHDLIDGVILLPENLFYNTGAAGVIVVLQKRKPPARAGKIVLLNATKRVKKGAPKNYVPQEDVPLLAAMYAKGEPIEGEVAVITTAQAVKADYNLGPSRWVGQANASETDDIGVLVSQVEALSQKQAVLDRELLNLLAPLRQLEASDAAE